MQEMLFPTGHKLLSSKHVQPVVDKYIALTHQYLEERADNYNGLNIPLRDFIVPLAFDASAHAFFGKTCPVDDLIKWFGPFDESFHLLAAGIPKIFVQASVKALGELTTIMDEKYLSKPDALDDASEVIKAYDRITREDGFVSHPFHKTSLHFDRLLGRTLEKLPRSPPPSFGPSRRMPHSQRTGLSLLTSNSRTVLNPLPQRLTRPWPHGTLRTHPSLWTLPRASSTSSTRQTFHY